MVRSEAVTSDILLCWPLLSTRYEGTCQVNWQVHCSACWTSPERVKEKLCLGVVHEEMKESRFICLALSCFLCPLYGEVTTHTLELCSLVPSTGHGYKMPYPTLCGVWYSIQVWKWQRPYASGLASGEPCCVLGTSRHMTGWGWDALGAVGRKEALEGNEWCTWVFLSDEERKDFKNIWNVEILVLGVIKCRKIREKKVSKLTPKFLSLSTE